MDNGGIVTNDAPTRIRIPKTASPKRTRKAGTGASNRFIPRRSPALSDLQHETFQDGGGHMEIMEESLEMQKIIEERRKMAASTNADALAKAAAQRAMIQPDALDPVVMFKFAQEYSQDPFVSEYAKFTPKIDVIDEPRLVPMISNTTKDQNIHLYKDLVDKPEFDQDSRSELNQSSLDSTRNRRNYKLQESPSRESRGDGFFDPLPQIGHNGMEAKKLSSPSNTRGLFLKSKGGYTSTFDYNTDAPHLLEEYRKSQVSPGLNSKNQMYLSNTELFSPGAEAAGFASEQERFNRNSTTRDLSPSRRTGKHLFANANRDQLKLAAEENLEFYWKQQHARIESIRKQQERYMGVMQIQAEQDMRLNSRPTGVRRYDHVSTNKHQMPLT